MSLPIDDDLYFVSEDNVEMECEEDDEEFQNFCSVITWDDLTDDEKNCR